MSWGGADLSGLCCGKVGAREGAGEGGGAAPVVNTTTKLQILSTIRTMVLVDS